MTATDSADYKWHERLRTILHEGMSVAPRGKACLETLHSTIRVDLERSLVTNPQRHLNYRFAAAEALWMLDGSDRLEHLVMFNRRMSEFSDDGITLSGAYGPRIVAQMDYVVQMLINDPDTRQAVISIWKPNPKPSKDIPCTLALTFTLRDQRLHCHAFMRSSDVWLGVPYDLFSFSQVALIVAARVSEAHKNITPGKLWLTAASSHLYAENTDDARAIVYSPVETGHLPLLPVRFTEADVRWRLSRMKEVGRGFIEWTS